MTAPTAPRQALELLDDVERAISSLYRTAWMVSSRHNDSVQFAPVRDKEAETLAVVQELRAALRAQAEAAAGLREAVDAAIQCETDVLDVYQRRTSLQTLDLAVAELKRDSLPKLKAARAALAQAGDPQ